MSFNTMWEICPEFATGRTLFCALVLECPFSITLITISVVYNQQELYMHLKHVRMFNSNVCIEWGMSKTCYLLLVLLLLVLYVLWTFYHLFRRPKKETFYSHLHFLFSLILPYSIFLSSNNQIPKNSSQIKTYHYLLS